MPASKVAATKKCSKCSQVKSLGDFSYHDKRRGTRVCWCKECRRTYMKAYHQKNRAAILERVKKWTASNSERKAEYQRAYRSNPLARERDRGRKLFRNYGISLEGYYTLLEMQGGVCAICRGVNSDGKQLYVDHDHTSGDIRGLLCRKCNYAVGLLDDSSENARRLCVYLERA